MKGRIKKAALFILAVLLLVPISPSALTEQVITNEEGGDTVHSDEMNMEDTETLAYTVSHIVVDGNGNQTGGELYSFEASAEYRRGETAPELTEEMLRTPQEYPGYKHYADDKRVGKELVDGETYLVKYTVNKKDTEALYYTVMHIAVNDEGKQTGEPLKILESEKSEYWRGGPAPALTEEMLKKPDNYTGYSHLVDDERVGIELIDGETYLVKYAVNEQDTKSLNITVSHIVVNGKGNATGKKLDSFTQSIEYWAGGSLPVLMEAMLKKPEEYPGYSFYANDDRIGDTLKDGAAYVVKYAVNDQDTDTAVYSVEHIVVDEEGNRTGKLLNSFAESEGYWRGGSAPVLKDAMLKKPSGYPGYKLYETDARVSESIADGMTYVVKYLANYDEATTLSYTVSHVAVDLKGNETDKTLSSFTERVKYWSGGSAPALTDELLRKPDKYPGYLYLQDDERVGEALSDGAEYVVKYVVNETDVASISYTVAHIVTSGKESEADEVLSSFTERVKYWQGDQAPTLTEEMLKKPAEYPGYKLKADDVRVGKSLEDGAAYVVEYAVNEKDSETLSYTISHVMVDDSGNPTGETLYGFTEKVTYWRGGSAPELTEEMLKKPDSYPGYSCSTDDARVGETLADGETYIVKYVKNADVTIRYIARTGGSVSLEAERLNPQLGEAQGATATAAEGYTFESWTDASGGVVSTKVEYIPTKGKGEEWADGLAFYANFTADEGEVIAVKGRITWIGIPADSDYQALAIELYQRGGSDPYKATTVQGGGTGYSFEGLPRCDESGAEVRYTVRVVPPENYTATVDGYNIINTYMPGLTSVAVRVALNVPGGDDYPDVTVELMRDGVPYQSESGQAASLILTGDVRSGRFENLPKTAEDGHEYVYTVTLQEGSGIAQAGIVGTMSTGYTITLAAQP